MTLAEAHIADPSGDADRRSRILEAAERAFVRHGFHAATMQHVAAEAAMSPGNLYRYFRSKEAIVEGLCQRDQRERAAAFAAFGLAPDITTAMACGLRRNLLGKPREKMQMILEIWAEAGRNPAIAAMCGAIDADVRDGLIRLVETAKQKGQAHPELDALFATRVMITTVLGLFKRRAHEADFDGETELAMALGVFAALFEGRISPLPSSPEGEGP
jgi:AcrR family transcriptional regulator